MKYALIIGASSGIGLELARIYTATHRVVTIQRRPCPLADTVSVTADVTVGTELETALETALSYGTPSLVVYAAGASMSVPFSKTPDDVARKLFETNFWGYVRTLHAVLPRLQEKTRVVVLSSLASVLPIPFDPFYSASKSALNTFTEALQLEYPKIRFLSVLVGGTRTNFTFKRRVSPFSSPFHRSATLTLKSTEQHGLAPQTVAAGIALSCDLPLPPLFPTVGFMNHVFKFTARILPARLRCLLIRFIFSFSAKKKRLFSSPKKGTLTKVRT